MSSNINNTNRIFKNTIILYLRMVVIMLITLYSSRVILQALGISDYGLYNVVGGVVLLLGFLKSSLTSATQRFLSYEMGRKDSKRLREVFSMCLSIHVLIATVILVLAEIIGLWFLNTHINIPEGRVAAANMIFHFTVISLSLSVITVPYHACTISHERMSFFAMVSILDAFLKLGFAFALMLTTSDRLVLYGGLMMMTTVINLLLYWIYDRWHFPETHYRWAWDKVLAKQIFSFSGWTIWGQFAVVGSAQGKNILVNIFHSVAANAAIGVAHQVNSALVSLTSNFQTAFQPQLTKSYAAKDFDYLSTLIYGASKISFFLLFLASFPFMLNIDWVLGIWLKEVPLYSGTFCNLYIVASILNALATPLWITIFATGEIRNYQIALSVAYFSELLIIYLFFLAGFPPTTAMVVKVGLNTLMVFIRLYFAKRVVKTFSSWIYTKRVLLPVCISTLITMSAAYCLFYYLSGQMGRWFPTLVTFVISILVAYRIGLLKSERMLLKSMIYERLKK